MTSVCRYVVCFVCIYSVWLCVCFFFFKQKTAYEMRISDWSSDVCSSDLVVAADAVAARVQFAEQGHCRRIVLLRALGGLGEGGQIVAALIRSEERRVGKECVSTCRSRWSPYH